MSACPNCGFQNAEGVKFCAECGEKLAAASQDRGDSRRTVTVLFADVSGSTALGEQLDPESLRDLMGRYFGAIKAVVERHGGTVEKFIGDAVMAVFGIPTLHEDDALRSVRAAAEIRDTLGGLNAELQQSRGLAVVFRTGVNTGEVVAGDPSAGQTLVTGDTVNTAARLEQAAQPGEILLGEATYRLVRDAVVAEPSEPIAAKGKAQPVPAYRLVSVTPGAAGHARRLDGPMVGRGRELSLLTDAFDRSVADRAGQLVTLLGAAGVGKSRLADEFRKQLGAQATFLVGRCLSYGEGITYWPLADALRAPAAVQDDNSVESWRAGLMALIAGEQQAEAIVEKVIGLIGVGEAAGGSEAFWAVRRLLEIMARGRPVVLVIDDLHWATPTFLDLVEHLAGWTRDAPILLVCLARPELLEARPDWGGSRMATTTIALEPLDATSTDELLANLLMGAAVGTGVPRRIAAAAEGNPLFVEELVAMLAERGDLVPDGDGLRRDAEPAELEVPPTIEALMAARLDQLPGDERPVLERASVVGRQFGAGEVAYLGDGSRSASVRPALMAMVRRDLLRPDPDAILPMGPEDEAFRFRHQLIRDGAYASMSKAERARLHERYARWLEGLPADRLRQLDEVVGYHLEQALVLWSALGEKPGAPHIPSRAAAHLGAAGLRASERSDAAAAANLLARAATLLPRADPQRIALLPHLANALVTLGRFDESQAAVSESIEATANGSSPAARVLALVVRSSLARSRGASVAERKPDIEEALAIAEATGDQAQLATVHARLGGMAMDVGRLSEARRELEIALSAAQLSGNTKREAEARSDLGLVIWCGTSPASDIHRILADNRAFARKHSQRRVEAFALRAQAIEAARRGRIPEARRLLALCLAIIEDIGAPVFMAATSGERGYVEYLAGDLAAREQVLREGYEQLSAMGSRGLLSTVAADLADALVDLGRIDEAEVMCEVAQEAGAEDDILTQVGLRLVRGRVAAARGSLDNALASVADALAIADQGEYYDLLTLSRLVSAELLLAAGRMDEGRARAQEVIDLARHRGDVVFEGRAKDLVERAAGASPAPN
jgi:class 3 adenylate cyclase/tetratricopeptide (TPR) repeat protein